ncbi:preprotein translocase subunit SecE [Pseudoclavibacter endophyticus]|uniref:Protein translocase subunit SecE n=1 Tax=Pseudoclavibacter endophyticus TaxID=1778590 RepID=A0A6H9WCL8_9MICO|nr:preprotein translocase subunit SecE [Pseudoclavibacter endophyticus]
MKDTASEPATTGLSKTPSKRDDVEKRRGFFGTIALFLRQVMAELKKVVTPTRSELFRYTGVVLVFVIIMMLLVTGLDLLFGWGASWVFGTGTEVQWPDFSNLFGGGDAPADPAAPAP